MVWYAWALVATIAVSTALTILAVGKPRQPITPATALVVAAVNGLVVWAIVELAT